MPASCGSRQLGSPGHKAKMAVRSILAGRCRKTRMCRFFQAGACERGDACGFAHGSEDVKSLPDLGKTKMCPNLLGSGSCSQEDCRFAHSQRELRSRPELPQELLSALDFMPPVAAGPRPPSSKEAARTKTRKTETTPRIPKSVGLQGPAAPEKANAKAATQSGISQTETARMPRLLGRVRQPEDNLKSLHMEALALQEMQRTVTERLQSLESRLRASEQATSTDDTESTFSCQQSCDTNTESMHSPMTEVTPLFGKVRTEPSFCMEAYVPFDRAVSAPQNESCKKLDLGSYRITVKNSFIDIEEECGDDAAKRASSAPGRAAEFEKQEEDSLSPRPRNPRSLRTLPACAR